MEPSLEPQCTKYQTSPQHHIELVKSTTPERHYTNPVNSNKQIQADRHHSSHAVPANERPYQRHESRLPVSLNVRGVEMALLGQHDVKTSK